MGGGRERRGVWRIRIDEKSGKTQGSPEPITTPQRLRSHRTCGY